MKAIKFTAFLLTCMLFAASHFQPVYASSEPETLIAITPRYTYISSTTTHLSNVNGKALCTAQIIPKSSTNLRVFMYLEKYLNGTWTYYTSFSDSTTGSYLQISKNVTVSSGTYRVKASYYANGENTIHYSATRTF